MHPEGMSLSAVSQNSISGMGFVGMWWCRCITGTHVFQSRALCMLPGTRGAPSTLLWPAHQVFLIHVSGGGTWCLYPQM